MSELIVFCGPVRVDQSRGRTSQGKKWGGGICRPRWELVRLALLLGDHSPASTQGGGLVQLGLKQGEGKRQAISARSGAWSPGGFVNHGSPTLGDGSFQCKRD